MPEPDPKTAIYFDAERRVKFWRFAALFLLAIVLGVGGVFALGWWTSI